MRESNTSTIYLRFTFLEITSYTQNGQIQVPLKFCKVDKKVVEISESSQKRAYEAFSKNYPPDRETRQIQIQGTPVMGMVKSMD